MLELCRTTRGNKFKRKVKYNVSVGLSDLNFSEIKRI